MEGKRFHEAEKTSERKIPNMDHTCCILHTPARLSHGRKI